MSLQSSTVELRRNKTKPHESLQMKRDVLLPPLYHRDADTQFRLQTRRLFLPPNLATVPAEWAHADPLARCRRR